MNEHAVVGEHYCYCDLTMPQSDFPSFMYTARGTISIQTLKYIQWMNYGFLCFATVVNPTLFNEVHVSKMFFGSAKPAKYCLKSLKVLWNNIGSFFNLNIDEKCSLIENFSFMLYEVRQNIVVIL